MSLTPMLRTRLKQAAYFALSVVYRFDRWHYRVVRDNCAYFDSVRGIHEDIAPRTTIEIGCGLGEILSGLRSPVRTGIDRDAAVIRAARAIRPRSMTFVTDTEFAACATRFEAPEPVCLIFLNWFHACTPEEVQRIVREYASWTRATHIVHDVITARSGGYRFQHPPTLLEELGSVTAVVDAGDGIRRLVVVQVRA